MTKEEYNIWEEQFLPIYSIFKETFTEDRVDTDFPEWNPSLNIEIKDKINILIYWPEVKIENERGESHIITDLYSKITFS